MFSAQPSFRFLDETLREGDSRGYHPHPAQSRLELIRLIHDITGIRHFSLGTAPANPSDRETLIAVLAAHRARSLPADLVVHVYAWFQGDDLAHQLLASLSPEDRTHIAVEFVCTTSDALARSQDGPWLAARDGLAQDWRTIDCDQLHARLASATSELLQRYTRYGLHSLGLIVQDAFRSTEAQLERYIGAALEAGAQEIRLHDTVGIASPALVIQQLAFLQKRFGGVPFFGHFHDDFGMATANTITALANGAHGADLTCNGIGNRAGNAATAEVLTFLKVAHGVTIPGVDYGRFMELARAVERHYCMLQSPHAAVTGSLVHMDEAAPRTPSGAAPYLPYDPALVGATIETAHAPFSGRNAVRFLFERNVERLRQANIEPSAELVERAAAWITRERNVRAQTHRPHARTSMDAYLRSLRASYVTDEDVLEAAIGSAGRFD